jgi:hypothetical protein
MKKTIIIALMSIIGIGFTNAQEELKGKKLKERLDSVYLNLQTGKFLEALDLFHKTDYTITDKTKRDKDYQTVASFINSIETIFSYQINHLKVCYGCDEYKRLEKQIYYFYSSESELKDGDILISKVYGYYPKDNETINNLLISALKSLRSRVKSNQTYSNNEDQIDFLVNVDSMKAESNSVHYSNKYIGNLIEVHNQTLSSYIKVNNALRLINLLTSELNPTDLNDNKFSNQIDTIIRLKNETSRQIKELFEGRGVYEKLLYKNEAVYNKVIESFVSNLSVETMSKENYDLTLNRLKYIKAIDLDYEVVDYRPEFKGFKLNDSNSSLINSKINDFNTSNPFRADMSKPIPNLGKETFNYIYNNCLSIYSCDPKIIDILSLDVYRYFNLTNYSTPLKMQLFEESEEYKNLKKVLLQKKQATEKSNFIIYNTYTNIPDYYHEKLSRYLIIGSYDLKSEGFTFKFNSTNQNSLSDVSINTPVKTFRCGNGSEIFMNFNSVQLPLTPKKYVTNAMYGFTSYGEEMFLPIDKSSALEIEDNPKNVIFCFIALDKIKGQKWTREKSGFDSDSQYGILSSDRVKMVVMNTVTGKIYFEKIYEKIVPKK